MGTLDFALKAYGIELPAVSACSRGSTEWLAHVFVCLDFDDLRNAMLVNQEWHACAIHPDIVRCLKNTHSSGKGIRGPYLKHCSDQKRVFRAMVGIYGKVDAKKWPSFDSVPRETLDSWAEDDASLPLGDFTRRSGGGRKSAFGREQLAKVFSKIDELRHLKKVDPLDVAHIAITALGVPTSYPDFKFSPQWVRDTCRKYKFGLHQITPTDENASAACTPEEHMNICAGFLQDCYSFRQHFRHHFCHGSVFQESQSVLPRVYNFDEISQEREPPPGGAGSGISRDGADPPSVPGEGTFRAHHTIGLTSVSSGRMEIPLIIFTGQMQPMQTIQEVTIQTRDGKTLKVKVFVAHTTTHTNNQYIYKEYLKTCIAPNFPTHDCPCGDPLCKSILFIDDDAKLHHTDLLKHFWEGQPHVQNLMVPPKETKHAQPNVSYFSNSLRRVDIDD